jgi:hypothetical protein
VREVVNENVSKQSAETIPPLPPALSLEDKNKEEHNEQHEVLPKDKQ